MTIRPRAVLPALLVALFALPVGTAVAQSADDPRLGSYAVVDDATGRTLCALDLLFEPTVGGQVAADPDCEAAAPPLGDAVRWFDDGAGGFIFEDALRTDVAKVVETEAGYVATLADGRRVSLVAPDTGAEPAPAERAGGDWTLYDRSEPTKPLCAVSLRDGGTLRLATGCLKALRPFANGRWTADEAGVTLAAKGTKARRFEWGEPGSLLSRTDRLALGRKNSSGTSQ